MIESEERDARDPSSWGMLGAMKAALVVAVRSLSIVMGWLRAVGPFVFWF